MCCMLKGISTDNQGLDNRGLTLIEVVVAVGIFAIVVTTVVELLWYGWHSMRIVWDQLAVQNEGRKVTQDLTNELRTANYSSIGSYPIASAGANDLTFYSDLDKDSYRERVRYFLVGTTLKKGVIIPTGTPLTYSTSSERVIDMVHDVANVAKENPLRSPVSFTIESKAVIRNLKNN
ncbi:MAG: hypothetical protein UX39_C0022G0013 [Candidatus Magasanikbacteria bacterium GW2011_GWA2_46_17]|uniref:Prepilin-type N-terminal cleavage/methylation domain-containing protein n=1 Tax=Candidatus Magasanikbacteria bacterium GW2011_GWA2_46_17 TaxID=1619042 RepID=A0A0G1NZB1_9BACT|nr:MAG: hypothetical protein UX39_C0022G0013 [Candidatus Magasanikbacteria bacterium GW2011_GWA2_46_17]